MTFDVFFFHSCQRDLLLPHEFILLALYCSFLNQLNPLKSSYVCSVMFDVLRKLEKSRLLTLGIITLQRGWNTKVSSPFFYSNRDQNMDHSRLRFKACNTSGISTKCSLTRGRVWSGHQRQMTFLNRHSLQHTSANFYFQKVCDIPPTCWPSWCGPFRVECI